ncbi:hypothetical protein OKW41_006150 [Paraburkholderia sp. UCT70]
MRILKAQISMVMRHGEVFGSDYSAVIRGCVIGGDRL